LRPSGDDEHPGIVPSDTDVAIVSIGVNDVVYDHVPPDSSRANVREIGRRLRARGIEVVLLPTGGRFQGALAAKPELHIEPGFGPKPVRRSGISSRKVTRCLRSAICRESWSLSRAHRPRESDSAGCFGN